MTDTTQTFVSYYAGGVDTIHAADCPRAVPDATEAHTFPYPIPGDLREAIIDNLADMWSDHYKSTEAAIANGELKNASMSTRVCPCAINAGFVTTL